MGTKVESDNYLPWQFSMRDLNHEPNGVDWPSCYNDVNLPNGESYNGVHPRTTIADSHIGYDKDLVKQTMLKHEAIFKGQVYDLHRLYRVQRDLMDEFNRKQQLQRRIPYETSSSSSPLPLHTQPKDTRTCNGSTFPFTNPGLTRPPDNMQSSPNSIKGKGILAGPSPKNSGISESRPTKLRKRNLDLDLELPADEFIGADEVEQFGRGKYIVNVSSSPDEDVKPTFGNGRMFPSYHGKGLADLNEPVHVDYGSHVGSHRDVPARLMNGNGSLKVNGMSSNLSDVRGNGQNWLCSTLESEHYKASVKSINLGILPEKARVPAHSQPPAFLRSNHIKAEPWKLKSFGVTDNSDCNYSLSNNHVNPLGLDQTGPSWVKPEFLGQKPVSFQPNPFLFGPNLSKSHQPPIGNGFYQSSSPAAHFPSPGFDYATYKTGNNVPCNTKNSSNPVKEMNLNVTLPNGVSDDYNNPKAPSTVLPWRKGKDATNKSESSRKLFGVPIFGNTSISKPKVENHNEEIECREKKVLFDMNIPCEEHDKMTVDEAAKPVSVKVGNNFDLNSCITEEEIEISSIVYNSPRVNVTTGIDLEALMNNEVDSDDEDHELATSAASAIVAMSSFVNNPIQPSMEETTFPPPMENKEDDILYWFTSLACSRRVGPDGLPVGLDDFEYTILKQQECTPKEYFPEPSTPDFKFLENNITCALTKKPRKGQARRGRQKQDFQRDILPGLTTLSRVEVTEDLNSFGGVLGSNRTRNGRGRGRRRLVIDEAICPPPLKEAEEVRINSKVEVGFEDVSFTGWGKTTRRPRRQRCPPSNHALPLPLT